MSNVHSLLGPLNHHALLIFFKNAASLASNNFLSVYQEDQLLQWIIENVTLPNLQMLLSVNMPTQAFARAMFRSALRREDVDVIRTLFACGVDAHTVASSCERLTPLELVASSGHLELASTLLKWGIDTNSYSETTLAGAQCAAANRGNIDIVRLLLEKGAPVNMLGYSVLASAVAKPWLWCNKRGGDDTLLQTLQMLLNSGARVEQRSSSLVSGTALQCTAESGNVELARVLWNVARMFVRIRLSAASAQPLFRLLHVDRTTHLHRRFLCFY